MRQALEIMVRHSHHRDSSLSSLGSWSTDIGAMVEEISVGDGSLSDHSGKGRARLFTGMAILASSSPEIRKLSRSESLWSTAIQSYQGSNLLPSANSSIASDGCLSRANVTASSFCIEIELGSKQEFNGQDDEEESKFQDDDLSSDTSDFHLGTSSLDRMPLNFEILCIEPPPATRRKQVIDIAKVISPENKENLSPADYQPWNPLRAECKSQEPSQLPRNTANRQDSLGSSCSSGKRPPKPQRMISRHRRVSHDSLPSPSEIAASVAGMVSPSPESTRKTHRRRNSGGLIPPRNLSGTSSYR